MAAVDEKDPSVPAPEPKVIQLEVSRRDSIQQAKAAQVIPGPGTRFLPTGVSLPPAPAASTTAGSTPVSGAVSSSGPKPPVTGTPGKPEPPRPGEPPGRPEPSPGKPQSVGALVRQLVADIRVLGVNDPDNREVTDRAVAAAFDLAERINTAQPPEREEFRPDLQRFFFVEHAGVKFSERMHEAVAMGRELARDTDKPVVVAQAVIVLNHQKEVREDWL